jgi:hypothetical protein
MGAKKATASCPGADGAGVGPVPVQMWQGWAQTNAAAPVRFFGKRLCGKGRARAEWPMLRWPAFFRCTIMQLCQSASTFAASASSASAARSSLACTPQR